MTQVTTNFGVPTVTREEVIDGTKKTVTETTTLDTDGGRNITSVDWIPYMRELEIDYVSYGNRPIRQIYPYFDNVSISTLVSRFDRIDLDAQVTPNTILNGPRETINIGLMDVDIMFHEHKSDGNTSLYVKLPAYASVNTGATVGALVTGSNTGTLGNVVSYTHASSLTGPNTNTSQIHLSYLASPTDNAYLGNTITIVSKAGFGETANIVSYNGAGRIATISPALSNVEAGRSRYSLGDPRKSYAANTTPAFYTTEKGFAGGTFHVPNPETQSTYLFRTGDRILRLLDNPQNDIADYTSRADYRFTSAGLQTTVTQVINRQIDTKVTISSTVDTVRLLFDPIAQSFYIDPLFYPEGVFISSIEVCFKNRDDTLPIEMQVRPMVNGVPDSFNILPGSVVIKQSEEVKISDFPSFANTDTSTKFVFPSPIYLVPGEEYAFVLITGGYGYDIFTCEVGGKILGTDRVVSRQPYLGSMFKSQNSRTYTPIQNEDIMFRINKCVFDTSGTVTMRNYVDTFAANTNTNIDLFVVHSDSAELPGTKLNYSYKSRSIDDGVLDSTYTDFNPDTEVFVDERKVIRGPHIGTKDFEVKFSLSTTNPDVSPIIFKNRQQVVGIENEINNLPLANTLVSIANTGSGYYGANTSVTITADSGSGANAYVTGNGSIASVVFDEVGYGYSGNVTLTLTSPNGVNGSIVFNDELSSLGGTANTRYVQKPVTLADGIFAGDLRVYVTAVKPPESEIYVYAKIRNTLDPEPIDDKNWFKLVQAGSNRFSRDLSEAFEYEYRPSLTANNVSYTTDLATYDTWNQFQIKVVLASSSTLGQKIPYVKDVIAIALLGEEF